MYIHKKQNSSKCTYIKYFDDSLPINNPKCHAHHPKFYLYEFEIKETTESDISTDNGYNSMV